MRQIPSVVVTGLGIEIPGIHALSSYLDAMNVPLVHGQFAPEEKLGRKGLRYKDRATKLALCAAASALSDAGLPTESSAQRSPENIGVVVSSNLGNLDTVCRVVETIRAGSVNDTSPMDLPNASSNVIASSLAIRFGCRAINLMFCNGSTSGIDALHIARNAIRTKRAVRMLVVGVEPLNLYVERLMQEPCATRENNRGPFHLGDGAGAVVLESHEAAEERGAAAYGYLSGYGYGPGDGVVPSVKAALNAGSAPPDLWLMPTMSSLSSATMALVINEWKEAPPRCLDLGVALGETYGALGVLQCITACLWFRRHGGATAVTTSGNHGGDGYASLVLHRQN